MRKRKKLIEPMTRELIVKYIEEVYQWIYSFIPEPDRLDKQIVYTQDSRVIFIVSYNFEDLDRDKGKNIFSFTFKENKMSVINITTQKLMKTFFIALSDRQNVKLTQNEQIFLVDNRELVDEKVQEVFLKKWLKIFNGEALAKVKAILALMNLRDSL